MIRSATRGPMGWTVSAPTLAATKIPRLIASNRVMRRIV